MKSHLSYALMILAFATGQASGSQVIYYLNFGPEAVGATGTGTGTVTFDTDASTMLVDVQFSGLSGSTTVAHIHGPTASPYSGTFSVITTTPSFPGFPTGVSAGSYNALFDMTLASSYRPAFITDNGGTTATAFAAFLSYAQQGRTYFNIHSSIFPAGEIRAFLNPVPEPSSVILSTIGLAFLAIRHRRAKRKEAAQRVV